MALNILGLLSTKYIVSMKRLEFLNSQIPCKYVCNNIIGLGMSSMDFLLVKLSLNNLNFTANPSNSSFSS